MSLTIPDHYYNQKLLSIDPGLNNIGVSIISFDEYNKTILNIESFSFEPLKNNNFIEIYGNIQPERIAKLNYIYNVFSYLLNNYQPFHVVSESPFFYKFRPSAFAVLTEAISTIHSAIINYNSNVTLEFVAPLSAKKFIGSKLNNDKELVLQALLEIKELNPFLLQMPNLTDHAIDSIAIGYTFLKERGFL